MTDLLKYANHLTNCRYRGGHDCDCGLDEIREQYRTGAAQAKRWRCGARQRNIGPEVQDCDWPVCGCDPYASKVLDAIAESGFKIVPDPGQGALK